VEVSGRVCYEQGCTISSTRNKNKTSTSQGGAAGTATQLPGINAGKKIPPSDVASLVAFKNCTLITARASESRIHHQVTIELIQQEQRHIIMSSATLPISPAAFAEALKDLPLSTLHLKAAELRNSIAHLDYSNEQLKPFADGTEPSSNGPDQDCIDAIKENEVVIQRMEDRIGLLKKEVEDRGCSWTEFQGATELEERKEPGEELVNGAVGGEANGERSNAWTDGTFQTGRIVGGEVRMDAPRHASTPATNGTGVNGTNGMNGAGGRLDDEALRRAMEDRMRDLATEDDDEGLHL